MFEDGNRERDDKETLCQKANDGWEGKIKVGEVTPHADNKKDEEGQRRREHA